MSQFITLTEAAAMTLRYRQNNESILTATVKNKNVLPLSETFERAAIEALLSKPSCTALRLYYGMDEELKIHAIIVGSDASNTDILPPATVSADEEDGYIIEQAIRCPPTCPNDSPLNEP